MKHGVSGITLRVLGAAGLLMSVLGYSASTSADILRPSVPLAVTIAISKTTMTFNAPVGGPAPAPQTLKLTNIGASAYNWKTTITTTSGGAWLVCGPSKGHRNPGQSKSISIGVNSVALAAGTYTGNIRFAQKNDASNFVDLAVTLNVRGTPFIDVQPAAGLTFFAPTGSGLQPAQTLTLTNAGGQTLNWSQTFAVTTPVGGTWLSGVTPPSGSLGGGAAASITVSVDATGLAAGTYNGSVSFTGNVAPQPVPVVIPITLIVSDLPVLEVNPLNLDFNAPISSPAPAPQTVSIRNAGGSSLDWSLSVTNSSTWLTVTPTSGTGILPGVTQDPAFTVSVNAGVLGVGTYSDTIVVSCPTAGVASVSIPVTFTLDSNPVIDVTPLTLTFNAPEGGPDPAIQTVAVSNQGGGTMPWLSHLLNGSTWVSMNVTSGNTPAGSSDTVQVQVSVAGLVAGTYSEALVFDDGTGTIEAVFVTLNVLDANTLQLTPNSLSFNIPVGGAPDSQTVKLQNVGGAITALTWAASSGASWLTVAPTGGSLGPAASTDLTITANPSGLAAGAYVGEITVTGNATNSPQVISVSLNVIAVPQLQVSPLNLTFDVPENGAASQQTVTVEDVGGGANLLFTTSANQAWLGVTPASGSLATGQSGVLTVTATPGALTAGTYTGLVTVTSSNGLNSPQSVFVTMNVVATPKMDLSSTSLTFNLAVGSAASNQTVTLSNVGGGPTAMTFTIPVPGASWLSATPANGNIVSGANTTLTITATPGANIAGTYTGTVQVNSGNATNAPQSISVTMNLTSNPQIGKSPASLTFTTGIGVNPAAQPVTITNTGGGSLGWSAASAVNTPAAGTWLSLTGTTTGTLASGLNANFNAAVDVTGLAAGTYSGTITLTAAGATNSPQAIPVTLNVLGTPAMTVAPTSLTYTTPVGVPPATQTLTVSSSGGQNLDWSASTIVTTPAAGTWLGLTGTTSGTGLAPGNSAPAFTVTVDVTGLVAGTYSGTVRITGAAGTANSPLDVPVTLNILGDPTIALAPPTLIYTVIIGTGNPASQTVTVTNVGDLTLNWSAASAVVTPVAGTWLSLTGVTAGALTQGVSAPFDAAVDVTGLAVGTYTGTITVTGTGSVTNSPQTIGVTLNVDPVPVVASSIPKAGYCGSVGFDVALPLLILLALRKLLRNRRAVAGLMSVLLAAVAILAAERPAQADELSDLPRSLQQEEPAKQRPQEMPVPAKEEKPGEAFLDFGHSSINPHLGVIMFSSKFESDPKFAGGVEFRVASPWLSRIFSDEPDRLGFLVDLTGATVNRDITISSGDKSGTLIFFSAALYATVLRSESFELQAEGGLQYGYFGGVEGLDNGIAGLLGLRGALKLGDGLWITLTPRIAIGDGSQTYFISAGMQIDF